MQPMELRQPTTPSYFHPAPSTATNSKKKPSSPPNLDKISKQPNIADYHKHYIAQFKNAAATIDHYKQSIKDGFK